MFKLIPHAGDSRTGRHRLCTLAISLHATDCVYVPVFATHAAMHIQQTTGLTKRGDLIHLLGRSVAIVKNSITEICADLSKVASKLPGVVAGWLSWA